MKKTLKKIVPLLAAVFACAAASAWDWGSYCGALEGKHFLLKAGIGYGVAPEKWEQKAGAVTFSGDDEDGETFTQTGNFSDLTSGFVLPIQAEYLLGKIPLGITLSCRFQWGKNKDMDPTILKTFSSAIMAGLDYHMAPGPEWLDFYLGAKLGGNFGSFTIANEKSSATVKKSTKAFAYDVHAGATFFLAERVGINAEIGTLNKLSMSAVFNF
ncbi:MAG: outer membrane beta-barrel protein [Bacteroides sp.]|nr:outer membrane beta-barrel protein [Prevotella sp.]MCM1408694.1 outer membrane beta-barrel protein [Treponema brennaborense]MCM1470555.1 outer membrane beta-barrel protein [Bacteroides sp.]